MQAEGKEHPEQVEKVLNHLVVARKSIQIYPPNNPRVGEALEDLVGSLNDVFSAMPEELDAPNRQAGPGHETEAVAPESSERPAEAENALYLVVSRDVFLLGDQEVGSRSDAIREFARLVYRCGIKLLCFTPGATHDELRRFLTVLSQPREVIKAKGGVAKELGELGLEHVSFECSDSLDLVTKEEAGPDFDMLGYLRRKRAGRARVGTAHAPRAEPGVSEAIADLADFFIQVAEGSHEMEARLFNTLGDAGRLAATLSYVAETDARSAAHADNPVSLDALRRTLRYLTDSITTLSEDTRATYMRNMANAILSTDSRTREWLKRENLASGVGQNVAEDEILAFLSDDAVADVLSNHAIFHSGTASTISNFLDEFSKDKERRDAVMQMVVKNLSLSNDDRLKDIADVLARESVVGPSRPQPKSGKEQPLRDRVREERESLVRDLSIHADEVAALAEQMEVDCLDLDYEYGAEFVLYLRSKHDDNLLKRNVPELIETGLVNALKGERYEVAFRILESMAGEKARGGPNEGPSLLDPILARCAQPEYLNPVLDALRGLEKGTPEYVLLAGILRFLGEHATEALFDRLVAEENRSTRLFVASMLIEPGEASVRCLSRKAGHSKWFVARNVAYLLGKIGSEAGLDALERLIHHEEARVRKEAVQALGAVRGQRAQDILIDCMKHPDPTVGGLAAEWLGNLQGYQALPVLVEMLSAERKRLYRQPELAKGIVRALGRLGKAQEINALRKFTPPRWKRLVPGKRDIAQACDEAVAEIRKRAGGRLRNGTTR